MTLHVILSSLIVISAHLVQGATNPASPISERIQEVDALIQKADYQPARTITQDLIRQFPDDPRPYLLASFLEMQRHDNKEAIRLCTHSLMIQSSSMALISLTRLYIDENRLYEATNAARRAAAISPQSPLAWVRLGQVHTQRNLPLEAEEVFAKALEISPDFIQAKIGRASNYLMQGQALKAKEILETILLKDSNHAKALEIMGRVLLTQNELHDAIGYLRRSCEIESKDPVVHRELADALVRSSSYEEAEQHFRESIKLDPKDERAYYGLAALLMRQKKAKESSEVFAQYKALHDEGTRVQASIDGTAEFSPWKPWQELFSGNAETALSMARKSAEQDPYDPVATLAIAASFIQLGTPIAAEPYILQGQFQGPLNGIVYANLGGIIYKGGYMQLARNAWSKALYADPGQKNALDALVSSEMDLTANAIAGSPTQTRTKIQKSVSDACMTWLKGEKEKAAEILKESLSESPQNILPCILLGEAYAGLYDWESAIATFQSAEKIGPLSWMPSFLHGVALANQDREPEALVIWDRINMKFSANILPTPLKTQINKPGDSSFDKTGQKASQ